MVSIRRYLEGSLMPDLTSSLHRENVEMARGSPENKDIVFFKLDITLETTINFA